MAIMRVPSNICRSKKGPKSLKRTFLVRDEEESSITKVTRAKGQGLRAKG
jgi:hypothetical protein